MSHPIVHFELWSSNPEAAAKFYAALFGWKINYNPQLTYWLIDTGATMGAAGSAGGINGGMFKPQEGPLSAKITLYAAVDDVGAAIAKAIRAGAKVLLPETEIPGVGWSAVVLDPDDRAIGLFKPLMQAPPAKPAAAKRKAPAKKPRAAAKKQPAKASAAAKKRPAKKK